jgi:phosphoribosyl 1,2-cyclic phosphate phosphodiesterase
LHELTGSIELFGLKIEPVPVLHGPLEVLGFRFGRCAYLTDFSTIPDASLAQLADLDILFLDALRHVPHPTHCTVEQALAYVERLKPRRAFFTHVCHDLEHEATNATLPAHVRLAHDGLQLEVTR